MFCVLGLNASEVKICGTLYHMSDQPSALEFFVGWWKEKYE